jgi:hypothetical protein
MQRENYTISYNGKQAVKHKWNAAVREIERLIKEIAREENTTYTLTGSHSEKEGFYHVSGYRQWEREDGKIVMFEIRKES